jgi:hypothetical protein
MQRKISLVVPCDRRAGGSSGMHWYACGLFVLTTWFHVQTRAVL